MPSAYTPASGISDSFVIGYILTAVLVGGTEPGNPRYGMRTDAMLGSIDPPDYSGAIIKIVENRFGDGSPVFFEFTVSGTRAQNFFTSITISGFTLLSADADIFNSGPVETTWAYNEDVPSLIPEAGTYSVIITP